METLEELLEKNILNKFCQKENNKKLCRKIRLLLNTNINNSFNSTPDIRLKERLNNSFNVGIPFKYNI